MNDKIKVGIWGLGRAGLNMHAQELKRYPEQFKIHSGIDTDPERNELLSSKYGAKTTWRIVSAPCPLANTSSSKSQSPSPMLTDSSS